MNTNAITAIIKELTKILNGNNESMPFNIQHDEILTTDEVCKILKINRSTLHRWLNSGKFPIPIDINGKKRWPTSAINSRIYEDNPQLREREYLLSEARRISKSEECESAA